jgi:hypothetical protein
MLASPSGMYIHMKDHHVSICSSLTTGLLTGQKENLIGRVSSTPKHRSLLRDDDTSLLCSPFQDGVCSREYSFAETLSSSSLLSSRSLAGLTVVRSICQSREIFSNLARGTSSNNKYHPFPSNRSVSASSPLFEQHRASWSSQRSQTPSPIQRRNVTHSGVWSSRINRNAERRPRADDLENLPCNEHVVATAILPELIFGKLSEEGVIRFVAVSLSHFVGSCPYHAITKDPNSTRPHANTWECEESGMAREDSHFRSTFKPSMDAGRIVTPTWRLGQSSSPSDFRHMTACVDEDDNHQDWWTCLAYVVWRCEALRRQVLSRMCISPDRFRCLTDYTRWVVLPISNVYQHLTNLVAIAFVYFDLLQKRALVNPEKGYFELDCK